MGFGSNIVGPIGGRRGLAGPTSFGVTGDKELQRKLLQLSSKFGPKIVRKGLRAGAKIILARQKAMAPIGKMQNRTRVKGTGARAVSHGSKQRGYMKRALVVRAGKKNRKGTFAVRTGFDTQRFPDLISKGKDGRKYFYPAAVEYGHKNAQAHPFLRPAFDATKSHATRRILRLMARGIERVAKK